MVVGDVPLGGLGMLSPPVVGLLAELPEILAFNRRDDPRMHRDTGVVGTSLDLCVRVIWQVQPKAL
ncbi:MAG: hypothetical protein ACRDRP_10955 [Pseudonocardiaceae bacterium]